MSDSDPFANFVIVFNIIVEIESLCFFIFRPHASSDATLWPKLFSHIQLPLFHMLDLFAFIQQSKCDVFL